mmetsp:Transcript_36344/g.77357  ORF Transcript_36344/g.77357 Transcript_36344/m.77357 type:complete len:437 (+) Transcript_36344:96-1406(+)
MSSAMAAAPPASGHSHSADADATLPASVPATSSLIASKNFEDEDDVAASPRLYQAFPVVAPLSDKKLGPQDVRPSHEMHPRLLEKEDADEAWRFRRDRAQAALLYEQRRVAVRRRAAEAAERDLEAAKQEAIDRKFDIDLAAKDRARRGHEAVQAMKKRMQDAQEAHRYVDEDCRRRREEAQALFQIEKEASKAVEDMLAAEVERNEAWRKRLEKLEADSLERRTERQRAVEEKGREEQARIEEAKQLAEQRLLVAEERARQVVELYRQEQLALAERRCQERSDTEVRRNQAVAEEAHRQLHKAAARLGTEEMCMKQHIGHVDIDGKAHLDRIVERQHKTEAFVDLWHRGPITQVVGRAANKSQAAHRREELSKTSLEQSAHVLGHHYKTQRHYNLTTDSKVSHILDGVLHDAWQVGTEPPSARSLPVPHNLAGLQ